MFIWGVSLYQSALFKNETITIAGKLGAEPEILIQMYKELIEDNTKTEVELKPNFGKTSFCSMPWIKGKSISILNSQGLS